MANRDAGGTNKQPAATAAPPALLSKLPKDEASGKLKCLDPLNTYTAVSTQLLYEDDKKESQALSNEQIEIGDEYDSKKVIFGIEKGRLADSTA